MKYVITLVMLICLTLVSTGFANTRQYVTLRYQVTGIDDPAIQKNVKLTMLNLYSKMRFPLKESEALRFLEKAPKEMDKAITPYGFFHSTITSKLIKGPQFWLMKFKVSLGPPLLIASVHTEIQGAGKNDPAFLAWQKKLPLHVGDRLQTELYEKIKMQLYDLATDRGYFQAKMIENQIRINLIKYRARITIVFNTGPRSRFGQTTFTDNAFHERFLRRFLTYHEGEYYNAQALENTQARLAGTDYFSQVIIKTKPKEIENGAVPIVVNIIPRKAKQYTFGLGYGTDTGARGTAGVTLRNLGGDGHRFQTIMRASQENSSVVAKYLIPGEDPANDLWTIAAGATNITQSTGSAKNVQFGPSYAVASGHWKHSLSLYYLAERYNITTLPNTSTQLVYPTWTTKYFHVDHTMRPHKGISFQAQLTGASKDILSETNFTQVTVAFKSLYTFETTKTRLLFRTNEGYTDIAQLNNLPLSLQLFAGGSTSMRGFGYNSVGPGRNLVVTSTEIQQRIYGDFYLAGFIDAGVVTDNNIFQHINAGSGPGLAWLSPIGTLELTAAEAFTQSNRPWSIQFAMGTDL